MLLARRTGWYGNFGLIDFVIKAGLSFDEDDIKIAKHDVHFECNIARQIWIITLRSLFERVRELLPLSKAVKKIEPIREYKYTDLVTPGLIYLLKEDMDRVDVEGYVKAILKHSIVKMERFGRILSEAEKNAFLDENLEKALEWVIGAHKIEKGGFHKLPDSLFRSPEEKYYVLEKLAATLDWSQYYRLVVVYNSILTELIHNSNQLGGLDCTLKDTHLITAVPSVFDIVRPLRSIPFEVCFALMTASKDDKLNDFTPNEGKAIREFFAAAKKDTTITFQEGKLKDNKEVVLALMNRFAQQLNGNMKIVTKACFIFWDEFVSSAIRELEKKAKKAAEVDRILTVPDCYVLVEGPSDEIVFSHFLTLLKESPLIVYVQNCEGKQGIKRRFKDILEKESYIGSIVTILDSDGSKEHEDLKRISKGNAFIKHHIFTKGAVEDLFSCRLHAKIINRLFPSGEPVLQSDLRSSAPIEKAIRRTMWIKKKVTFDKKMHAQAIVKELKERKNIPAEAREIVMSILELAKLRTQKKPRLYSHLTIDRHRIDD